MDRRGSEAVLNDVSSEAKEVPTRGYGSLIPARPVAIAMTTNPIEPNRNTAVNSASPVHSWTGCGPE